MKLLQLGERNLEILEDYEEYSNEFSLLPIFKSVVWPICHISSDNQVKLGIYNSTITCTYIISNIYRILISL